MHRLYYMHGRDEISVGFGRIFENKKKKLQGLTAKSRRRSGQHRRGMGRRCPGPLALHYLAVWSAGCSALGPPATVGRDAKRRFLTEIEWKKREEKIGDFKKKFMTIVEGGEGNGTRDSGLEWLAVLAEGC